MEPLPLLLGHRGARGEKTVSENTLEAFDFALAQGCDGFEFDVRLSADNRAVICHNATISGRDIAESHSARLRLPALEEVLAGYGSKAFLDIELKVASLESIIIEQLRQFAPARGLVVSSFLPEVLRAIHSLDPAIPLGLICKTRAEFEVWPQLPVAYVIPHFTLLTRKLVPAIQAANKKVFVWTVNLPTAMKRLAAWGIDGIISDHPGLLVTTLGRRGNM